MKDLKEIRKEIDSIDTQIASLFEQRMQLSKEVAEYKIASGLSITDSNRESEIVNRNSQKIQDERIREYYTTFERTLIRLSCDYQRLMMEGMVVACCGDADSLAAKAVREMFPGAKLLCCKSYEEAYASTANGDSDTCVLPLEDSINGDIIAVADLLFSGDLRVNQVREHSSEGDDTVRFAALSRTLNPVATGSKMGRRFMLTFTVRNEAGALSKTLDIIGSHGYNMCHLHSHPMKGLMWNYYFFMEIDGDINNEDGRCMMQELAPLCDRLKLVGTFTVGL